MKNLNIQNILQILQASNYVKSIPSKSVSNVKDVFTAIQLGENGQQFGKLLSKEWQNRRSVEFAQLNSNDLPHITSSVVDEYHNRLTFFNSNIFSKTICLVKSNQNVLIKSQQTCKETAAGIPSKLLVSEYFLNSSTGGLDQFYSIQREQKIWWMRFSANPSRYSMEAYDFQKHSIHSGNTESIQSIDINANFSNQNLTVEHLTYVPYQKLKELFQSIPSNMSIIRSVININDAVGALLIDGCDNLRNGTIMLNRKLAPFQCLVACLHKDNNLNKDLQDLQTHIILKLQKSGLRVSNSKILTDSENQLKSQLILADNIGIPYSLIINETTLQNGLLYLRNRDTSLKETIHISDIDDYLLNIFT